MHATSDRTLSALEVLRARTREDHRALEDSLDLLGTRDVADLRAALALMLGVWRPAERALEEWQRRVPGVLGGPLHRRAPALEHDLALLGGDPSAVRDVPGLPGSDAPLSTPQALGLTYVLAGSALGGRVINRTLTTWLPQARRLRFLADDPGAGLRWRATRVAVEERLGGPDAVDDLEAAAAAAHAAFEVLLHLSRRPQARRCP